jgi:nitroimidazol reductase NimA-like FMN-containing flavoprotein (pyridoxamine 5'-phosphate oxidase superfamily)
MPRPLTKAEREQFLSNVHVGVVTMADRDRGPLVCPVWYAYPVDGCVAFVTKKDARKLELMAMGSRLSFLVQVEGDLSQGVLPKYVAVEGPIVKLETADMDRDLRPIVHRYLGAEIADAHLKATRGDSAENEVVVHQRPERWLTKDFAGSS